MHRELDEGSGVARASGKGVRAGCSFVSVAPRRLVYDMGSAGLRHYARGSYGVEMTVEAAERYWQNFFETYSGLKARHDREYRDLKNTAAPRPGP